MKTIFKSFKFRIYPSKEQEILLAKHFGAIRFVFNHYLNKRKESYLEDKQSLNYCDNANDLTNLKKDDNYIWLKEINSQSLQSSLRNLDTSYMKFFRKETKFPRFKSKYDRDFNAANNILKQGLKILEESSGVSILSGSGMESDIKQKQVESLSLDEVMKPETAKSLV
jgi:putative transposase